MTMVYDVFAVARSGPGVLPDDAGSSLVTLGLLHRSGAEAPAEFFVAESGPSGEYLRGTSARRFRYDSFRPNGSTS